MGSRIRSQPMSYLYYMHFFEPYQQAIHRLCEQYRVDTLFAIGSSTGDFFRPESDVDLVVQFKEEVGLEEYADNYFEFKFALEELFGRSVDLIEANAISNPIFRQVMEREKQLVYG